MDEKNLNRKPRTDTADGMPAATQYTQKYYPITRKQAKKYISRLTIGEKRMLNEMLKALEQKRQLLQGPLHLTDKDD